MYEFKASANKLILDVCDHCRVPTPYESLTEAVQAQSNQQKQSAIASSIPIKSSNLQTQPQNNIDAQQQTLQVKLSSISLAPSQATSSSTASSIDIRSPSPAQPQQQQMQTPQANYLKLQQPNAIFSTSTNSSSSNSHHTGPEVNRKYKHSPFLPRRVAATDPIANAAENPLHAYGSPKKESTLSSLGQSIFRNLTTSPFSHRKSEQKSYKPPLPGEDGGGGGMAMLNGNRPGFSNPSSPLLLNRKMIDLNDEQQYKQLQGNTSPIGECFSDKTSKY